jgi:hypothetical protein
MSAEKPVPCDCLNNCGDDPWLPLGKSEPCNRLIARQKEDQIALEKAANVSNLMKQYGADNVYDLIENLHTKAIGIAGAEQLAQMNGEIAAELKAERDNLQVKVVSLRTVLIEVVRISDRKHDAWDAAKTVLEQTK